MDWWFTLPSHQALNGEAWTTRPPQVGLMVLMTNFGIRELIIAKCTQWGVTQIAIALMMWVTIYRGESWVYFMPSARLAERLNQTVKHWILKVAIVAKHFVPPNVSGNHPGNRKDEKWFIRANQYYLGGATSANTSSFSAVGAIIDEFARVRENVANEGSLIGAARGRFSASKSGGVIRAFSTHNHADSALVTQMEMCDDKFYCEVKCPKCHEFSVLSWGSKESEFGIKFNSEGTTKERAESVRHVCRLCKQSWVQSDMPAAWLDPENTPFESAEDYCRWVSVNGLWLDTDTGHVKKKVEGEWVKTKPPEKCAAELCSDGMGLYGVGPWSTAVTDCITGTLLEKQHGDVGDIQRFENEYRGIPFLREMQNEIPVDEFIKRREEYSHKIPREVQYLTLGADFGGGESVYQIDGHGANGERWAIECKKLLGDELDSESRIYSGIDEVLSNEHENEDGVFLPITLAIMDGAWAPSYSSVRKLAAKNPTQRIVVYGYGKDPKKPMFDYDQKRDWDKEHKCFAVLINPHTASYQLYSKLKIPKGSPGYYHFPINEDFDRLYAEELGADRPVVRPLKGSKSQTYIAYEKHGPRNERHDVAKYNTIALSVGVERGMIAVRDIPVQTITPPKQPKKEFSAFGKFK